MKVRACDFIYAAYYIQNKTILRAKILEWNLLICLVCKMPRNTVDGRIKIIAVHNLPVDWSHPAEIHDPLW